MTVMAETSGKRARRRKSRPPQERSAATRRKLIEAAFDALYELGYDGTTSAEVCRRAGVSRGTLLYHFPTTADLVTAAADELFARRLDDFRAAFVELPRGSGLAAATVRMLWRVLSGPTFYAWLEILVAARRDPELRRKVRRVMRRFGAMVDDSFAGMFPGASTPIVEVRLAPAVAFPLLNGLALDRIWARDDHAEPVIALMERAAELLLAMTAAPEREAT
jgi:AcrR family transcriptional regulator